ncbi:DEAD/DEAH box helicase, partial [Marinobacter sp. Z-F4-2]
QHKEKGRQTYKERLAPLRDKRVVIIFDECHRSQFGDNHQAIKAFFPKAQLFGFTGTPIFDDNASYKQIDGTVGSYRTTQDIFEKQLHAYTITHAIDDRNVLRFHIDYFKPEAAQAKDADDLSKSESKAQSKKDKPDQAVTQRAVVDAILAKHEAATNQRRFNALLATASINEAIGYYRLLKDVQAQHQAEDPDYTPLNIACVFSPPANGDKDVKQLQEDLPQEKADNQQEPEQKKAALQEIIADYNTQYGTNHTVGEF